MNSNANELTFKVMVPGQANSEGVLYRIIDERPHKVLCKKTQSCPRTDDRAQLHQYCVITLGHSLPTRSDNLWRILWMVTHAFRKICVVCFSEIAFLKPKIIKDPRSMPPAVFEYDF